jgi:hypothetical protein
VSAPDIKSATIVEKWGRISGMLEGGTVNSIPNMYFFNFFLSTFFNFIGLVSFCTAIFQLLFPAVGFSHDCSNTFEHFEA